MHAELQALLELQQRDRMVRAVEEEIAAFNPELAELDAAVTEAAAQVESARHLIEEAGAKRVELEGKIETFRIQQDRRRQRLEWVRGAKEASTLMAEIDLGRSVLAREEAEWIRSSDRVQEAEQRTVDAEKALEDLKASQAARREEIAALKAEAQDRLSQAQSERAKAAAAVSKPLLGVYDRIRRGRAPDALYPLHGDSCGHCFTAVPMHRRRDIDAARQIVTCEACGVIVYSQAAVGMGA